MATQWFYRRAGAEHGPFSSGKIRRMVARGELAPTDLLWRDGMDEWRPAGESGTLFGGDEARAKKKRRRAQQSGPERGASATPALTAAAPWNGGRPLLTSIGIGAGAGVVISAILGVVILIFSGSTSEEVDDAAPPVAVAPVAPPAKPVAAKPEAPQPEASKPQDAQPVAPQAAAVETVAVASAPSAPDQPQADPPAESQPAAPEPELPADAQAVVPLKLPPRIRVRLPGEDF
jgi:hypothetical protein